MSRFLIWKINTSTGQVTNLEILVLKVRNYLIDVKSLRMHSGQESEKMRGLQLETIRVIVEKFLHSLHILRPCLDVPHETFRIFKDFMACVHFSQ